MHILRPGESAIKLIRSRLQICTIIFLHSVPILSRMPTRRQKQCLRLGWQSGRFRHQRSVVRIQLSANFILTIYCQLYRKNNKKTRRQRHKQILAPTILPPRVRVPSIPSRYALYFIVKLVLYCLVKRTKINKNMPGLAH